MHDAPVIPFGAAVAGWAAAWFVGTGVLAGLILSATGDGDPSVRQLALVLPVTWGAFGVALLVLARSATRTRPTPLADVYAVRFEPIDLVGIPIGVATQFVLVPAVYWPLRELWPSTFSSDRLEERAQSLADSATGVWVAVLAVLVVIGAPVVEELVYRGLLQRSLGAAIGKWVAWPILSLWFGAIHFSAVEIVGLTVAGLVFGATLTWSGRLATPVLAHAGFNAAALVLVFG